MSLSLLSNLAAADGLAQMEKYIDRAFGRAFSSPFWPVSTGSSGSQQLVQQAFPVDIIEHKDRYAIVADAPGMTEADIKVELHDGNTLVVSGEKAITKSKEGNAGAGHKVWRQERTFTRFSRAFTLPEDTRTEGISARLEHGVLTVEVPKTSPPPKSEPKRIKVQVAGTPPATGSEE